MARRCAKKPWLLLLFVLAQLTIISLEAIAVSEFDAVGNGVGLLVGRVALLGMQILCVVVTWSTAVGVWMAVGATAIMVAIDLLFLMVYLDRLDEKTGVTAIFYTELTPSSVAALISIVNEVRKCLRRNACQTTGRRCWSETVDCGRDCGAVTTTTANFFFRTPIRTAQTLTFFSSIGLAAAALVLLDSSRRFPFAYTILSDLFACIFLIWTPVLGGEWYYCNLSREDLCCPLSRSYGSAKVIGRLLMFWIPLTISIVGSVTAIVVAETVDDYLDRSWLITNLWVFSFTPAVSWLLTTCGFTALKTCLRGLASIFCPSTAEKTDEDAGMESPSTGRPKTDV